ncbi:MAG: hypothetical protein VXA34_09120 [Gammaproteobacteria bacterium]
MVEVSLAVWLGSVVALVALLWWRLDRATFIFRSELNTLAASLELKLKSGGVGDDFKDDLTERLEDLISETVGSMRPPALADHLGAIAAQYAQFKMHQAMSNAGPAMIAQEPIDNNGP